MIASDIHFFVFSGGGSRGVAYAGAIDEWIKLTKYNMQLHLQGAAGASIGALYAAGLVLGFPPSKIMSLATSTNLVDICGIDLTNLWTGWGLDSGNKLYTWVKQHIGTMTFQQMYQTTGRRLEVVITNLNTGLAEYVSHETYPNMLVAEGILTSMTIPPIFCPRKHGRHLYVDGGVADNYPILRFPAKHTLGLRVTWKHSPKLDTMEHYFSRLTYVLVDQVDKGAFDSLDEEYKTHSVTIDCGDVPALNWRINDTVTNACLTLGRQAIRDFVLKHDVRMVSSSVNTNNMATQTDLT